MTVSMDGMEDAHDHIRQRQGSWRRTERTIRWLAESKIQWGTNTVMQRDNAHQLYDLFKHIQGIGGKRYAYCGFSHVEVVGPPKRVPSSFVRGYETLPVVLHA